MTKYPKLAKVGNTIYDINTDYRIALKCDEISRQNIPDEERALAIIYLLFGDKGLENSEDWKELLQIAIKFLKCGKKIENEDKKEDSNISFSQDKGYIEASFFSDYNIDIANTDMHYWKFYDLLCGLTENCVLNRVRFIRDFDISQIKDKKEKEKWIKQKQQVELKKEKTNKEKELDDLFENQLKGG